MKDANEGNTALPVEEYTGAKATSAPELCVRYCDHLGLPWNITMISQAIAEKTLTIGTLAGRSPLSTASACIYMASFLMGQGKSAKAISDVAGVSDGTIRTAYKFLHAKKDEIIDKEWLKDGKGNMNNLPSS
jgi:transcription initiation factor TFIIB